MISLGGTNDHVGASLTLIASVAKAESLDNFFLFALCALANSASVIAFMTYSFTERAAHCHELNLSAFRAGLMGGRVFQTSLAITVMTDGSAVRIARYHRPDFSAFRTTLMGGRISITSHCITRRTDFLAGFMVLANGLVSPTNTTNTLHVSPPLRIPNMELEKERSRA